MAFMPTKRWLVRKPAPVAAAGQRVGLCFHRRSASGFTLVETLVVVGILAVLLGLLLSTLRGVKTSGRQMLEMSAARQLMMAYNAYANVHNGAVLPGYWTRMQARDEAGEPLDLIPAARYPWRIAPYLDYNFRGLYVNENQDVLEDLEYRDRAIYRYAVSLFPSLGINGTWIGGDEIDNTFDHLMLRHFGRIHMTRMSQAIRSEQLIVFASARGQDTMGPLGSSIFEGWYRIESPYFTSYRWPDEFEPGDPRRYGHLSPRYGGRVVAAFLDTHVGMLSKKQLKDMRHWAAQATEADWVLTPR